MRECLTLDSDDLFRIVSSFEEMRSDFQREGALLDIRYLEARIMKTFFDIEIRIPVFDNSQYLTLFPPYREMFFVKFTKNNKGYVMHRSINVGSMYNNPEYLERLLQIGPGDEWKTKLLANHNLQIDVHQAQAISLAIARAFNPKCREFHVYNSEDASRSRKHRPALMHEYGVLDMPTLYVGSKIYLRPENLGAKDRLAWFVSKALERVCETLVAYHK